MATTSNKQPSKFLTLLQAAASGLTSSNLTLLNSLVILGIATSKAEIIAKLKAYAQLLTASIVAKQAYLDSMTKRKAAQAEMHAFYAAFVVALKQALGPNNQGQLPGFGVVPPKARKSASPETKAIAKLKAAATRKARGTTGKAQKRLITATPQMRLQVVGADGQPVSSGTPNAGAATPSVSSGTPSAGSSGRTP